MAQTPIAKTPELPYYAVIFTSLRTDGDRGYEKMAERMFELASQQPGFLGAETARGADGLGITVSYWTSEDAIRNWKANAEHRIAQETGPESVVRGLPAAYREGSSELMGSGLGLINGISHGNNFGAL